MFNIRRKLTVINSISDLGLNFSRTEIEEFLSEQMG
jgi:hypothetical protein